MSEDAQSSRTDILDEPAEDEEADARGAAAASGSRESDVSDSPVPRGDQKDVSVDESALESDTPREVSIGEIEVTLTFEVGSQLISLDRLGVVKPGYLFLLETAVDEPVTVRANGKAIGRGSLVNVEGKIGVVASAISGEVQVA